MAVNLAELFKLDGKTAVVTGCARGLGKEIAMSLGRNGATLVLFDSIYPKETAAEIMALGAECLALEGDVSDEKTVEELTRNSISRFGKIDILINNAGVTQRGYIPTEELSLDEWCNVLNINLTGTFICCKHIGQEMIKFKSGKIVNIISTASFVGVSRSPAYCASKAGVLLLTKSLALEWAKHNVRINAVAPHYLETPLTETVRNSSAIYDRILEQIPLKRFGKASEMLGAIMLLCSDASSFMTGSVVVVDGGFLAK